MTRILIVDDHPTQIEGYRAILSLRGDVSFKALANAEQAYRFITDPGRAEKFDVVILDWSLPGFPEAGIFTGEDIGELVRRYMQGTKIMMITSHFKSFLLYGLTKGLAPEALMVKSDFGGSELLDAFEKVMSGGMYYTESVVEGLRKIGTKIGGLDVHNRRIIELLSQGVKTKSITDHLLLSQSTVEKRKAQIKDYLGIAKGSDEDIVMEAKRQGYI